MMKRTEPNQGKLLPHVEAEPNFYEMDLRHPLPPTPVYPQPLSPMGTVATTGAYPYSSAHAAGLPLNVHYPYGYSEQGPPPPTNYPQPLPYNPFVYPYPYQPNQTHPMYPPHGQEHMYNPYGMLAQRNPTYGQPQHGYPDPNAYNIYHYNQNPQHHPYPNKYENQDGVENDQKPHVEY
jgi:hypothetical protein